jgi:hypothetical protein
MFKFKKYTILSLISFTFLLILSATTVFLIDPYQHYRKAEFYKPYSFDNRYMVWGLLKNYDYDSVLIGSSMTANFRKDYVDDDLNLNILRVPLPGATAYEENLLIQKALQNKKLSTVIIGLDLVSFIRGKQKVRVEKYGIPSYLMNNSYIDDFKYLLNMDVLFRDSMKIFVSNFLGIKVDMIDFNTFWNWDYQHNFGKEFWVENYFTHREKSNIKNVYNINKLKESFNYNILPHFKNNPNIEFIIFFPPYSVLEWKSLERQKSLKDAFEFKRYIVKQSSKYANIKIYDFQIEKNITHNLDNYMDQNHYSGEINRWIISQIKDDNYLVSDSNVDMNLSILKEQITNYNLIDF